jgi:hypothetical protein
MSNLGILFELKRATLRNSVKRLVQRSKIELVTLFLFVILAGGGLFAFFHYGFTFFKGHEPFGPILINETFYLFNFALFVMLFISAGVSAYTALFESKEVAFLITRPVTWPEIYAIKLFEVFWFSSWSDLIVSMPIMTAYA